jgi:hypothetical protein
MGMQTEVTTAELGFSIADFRLPIADLKDFTI